MEHVISGLLQDFEAGKLTRRQLIQTLALGVTVGPAALAAAQEPAEKPSIPPPRSIAAWKTVWLDSRLLRCFRLPAKHRVLSRPDGMGDHSRRRPEAVLNENRQCWRHHYPKSRRIRGHRGSPDSADYHGCDRPHLRGIEPWDTARVKAELEKRGLDRRPDMNGKFQSFHVHDPDSWDLQISNQTDTSQL
jgi:hypothetical protein